TELKVAADTAIKVLNGDDYEEEVDAGTGLVDTSNAADYVDDNLAFAAMQ
ncbi:MAG: sugar ABC transporter substrate-binding protein, partial [Eubacterium sp.]|nr:sugar ABC transporter substrate-binding protein [Eubacterium sp.]